jgi:hypothetical protein
MAHFGFAHYEAALSQGAQPRAHDTCVEQSFELLGHFWVLVEHVGLLGRVFRQIVQLRPELTGGP